MSLVARVMFMAAIGIVALTAWVGAVGLLYGGVAGRSPFHIFMGVLCLALAFLVTSTAIEAGNQ